MSVTCSCPHCGSHFIVTDDIAGQTITCENCGNAIVAPTSSDFEVKNAPSGISKGAVWVVVIIIFAVIKIAIRSQPVNKPQPAKFPNLELRLPTETAVVLPVADEPIPPPTNFEAIKDSEVKVGFVETHDAGPAGKMQIRVYMPPGDHAVGTLPCVLVAPAGTNLLHGSTVENGNYHDEALPYAEAGMIVIRYSIDGPMSDEEDYPNRTAYVVALQKAYLEFKNASAGVDNGRRALQFAVSNYPQIDREKIYAAGHSSAGTLALMLAAKEPRICGCVAYAACYNLQSDLSDLLALRDVDDLFPGIKDFAVKNSPARCANQIKCPVFLFQAADDDNVTLEQTKAFAEHLRELDKDVTLETTARGGHYFAMLIAGIPRAIQWIEQRSAEPVESEPGPSSAAPSE